MIDLTGKKFGRLTVIREGTSRTTPNGSVKKYWFCQCECGNTKEICGYSLQNGLTTSCGCYRREKSPLNGIKHGLSRSRVYNIWKHIKARCDSPNSTNYPGYGGRGIKICDEWRNSFESFYSWAMSNGYSEELSIDRIDVNGNYEPNNCRWANATMQQNNKRNNRILEYKGETHTIAEWSRILHISRDVINKRIAKGDSIEEIIRRELH